MEQSYILTKNNITLIINDKATLIPSDHKYFKEIRDEIYKDNIDWDKINKYANLKESILSYIGNNITINGNVCSYKKGNKTIKINNNALLDRIIESYKQGKDVNYLIKFLDNVVANPLDSAIQELFLFLEANELPITNDGCFLAYKRVNNNYTDCYTGTMDNSIGKVVYMERKKVNPDRRQTCSVGLHFCSSSYLNYYSGARIVVVKVNPADVVAIPENYNNAKGRTWKYRVIGELNGGDMDLFKFANNMDPVEIPNQQTVKEELVHYEPVAKEVKAKQIYISAAIEQKNNLLVFATVKDARYGLKNRKIGMECYVKDKKTGEYRLYRFANGTANQHLIRIS